METSRRRDMLVSVAKMPFPGDDVVVASIGQEFWQGGDV